MRASFEAWLHADCGLTFPEIAEYSAQELTRLQLGWMIRQQQSDPDDTAATRSSASQRRRDIRDGQQQARQQMLEDIGFD